MGTLLTLFILILIVAAILWLLGELPFDAKLIQILRVLVILFAIIYLILMLMGRVPHL